MQRIIIFTGKGGVGKSSVAGAHALVSAREGKRTLLVSTDMAHNYSDIFETHIGHKITNIEKNLDVIELDPNKIREEVFPVVKKTAEEGATSYSFVTNSINENFPLPALENIFSLLKIWDFYSSEEYERIVVDCAPTSETLALLKLPELLSWYMEKFFPVGKSMVRVLSPISKLKYGVSLPKKESMNRFEIFHQKLLKLADILKDSKITTTRLVCIPEKMVVEETKRNFMYLNIYGYQTDMLFINRVIKDVEDDFLSTWQDLQRVYISKLKEVFVDTKNMEIPWFPQEIKGVAGLELLANIITKEKNLFDIKNKSCNGGKEEYTKTERGYILSLALLRLEGENIEIYKSKSDIYVVMNNFKRCIPLPNVLSGGKIVAKKFEEKKVMIEIEIENEKGEIQ